MSFQFSIMYKKNMYKWFGVFIDRLFVVAFAVLFSQFPLFIQQYHQRLSGHAAELHMQLDAMRKIAKQSGKTLDQYIQKFLASADFDFSKQGNLMHAMQERYVKLSDATIAMQNASVLTKPYVFLIHLDFEVAKAASNQFSPGLLFNLEGFCYALCGIAFGYLCFQILAFPFRRLKKIAL